MLLPDHLHIVRQALAGVLVEIDQAMPDAIGLVEPDHVSSSTPMSQKGVDDPGRIVRQRQADALLVARLGELGLEVATLERGVEAFLDAGGRSVG